MAGLDNIKKYATGSSVQPSEAPVETPTADAGLSAVEIKAPKDTGIQGKIALDPTQTENILANMQKYIDEREGFVPSLARGLTRGMATAYGPSSLAAVDREQSLQDKQLMDYRTQMAAYRAAQSQAQNESTLYKSLTPGAGGASQPGTSQPGAAAAAATQSGVPISPAQQAIEDSLQTAGEKLASRRKYYATLDTEQIKKQNAPAMAAKVEVWVPGEGKVEMTTAMAEKYLESNPKLQAIVNGNRVPAAQAIVQANTAATAAPTGAVSFSDPSIKIISGQRTPEKGKELWDASVANGTPGVQPNGLPVAKPGTSQHEKEPGAAYDIDPKTLTRSGRLELAQKGYYQPLGTDSPHWERIPVNVSKADVARGTTTSQTSSTADQTKPLPNETQAQYDQRMKENSEIASSRIKSGEAERQDIIDTRKASIETGNAISRIESTLNTEAGARAVGQFNKPGVAAAFGKILSEGIQAGNFGSVSFKGLEDAVRTAGGDQATINAAQSLARDFAQMQLNIAKRDLKGQGAVSDNERRIVERVTGSTSNSPEVLKDFARWNRVRNTFDKEVGDAAQAWEKANPNQSYAKFRESDEYKRLENAYIAKTDAMANKMGINGGKTTPSDNKAKIDELKKKYGPKKEST